jgi:hypothetical protein
MSRAMNKVSQVTFAFWVMKISATTLGETGGDLLSMTLNLGYVIRLRDILRNFHRNCRATSCFESIPSLPLLGRHHFNHYSRYNNVRLFGSQLVLGM